MERTGDCKYHAVSRGRDSWVGNLSVVAIGGIAFEFDSLHGRMTATMSAGVVQLNVTRSTNT